MAEENSMFELFKKLSDVVSALRRVDHIILPIFDLNINQAGARD